MGRNLIRIAKKLGLLLIVVILVSLSLPVHIALANGTTVGVNLGNPVTLGVGGSQSDIPLDIRGIVVSEGALGLAVFDFTLSWDADVIHVNSLNTTTVAMARGFQPKIGAINNIVGTVTFVGLTTGGTTGYSRDDLTVVTINISTAPGAVPGDSTSIDVTITDLVDNKLQQIPALPVNAPVQISLGALLSIAITPAAPSIMVGETQQFTATGTYTLGTADITGLVTWASHNPSVAAIDTAGLATSLATGTTTITATLYTVDGTTTLTVTETEAEEEEVVASPTEAEPGITNVSDSAGKNGVLTEGATAESEGNKVEPGIEEGPSTVKVPLPNPISWWVWLIVGLAVVAVIGVVSWLILRRRTT